MLKRLFICPWPQVDEGRVAGALRSACAALVAKNNTMFRAAGVAVWETRFRVPGGAWRLLTYCPTGIIEVMYWYAAG